MLKSLRYSLAALAIGCAVNAHAAYNITLDAGQLKLDASINLPFDNSLGSLNGALLMLVAAGGDSIFSDDLVAGQYVSGNDIILGVAGFNHNGGVIGESINETLSLFSNLTAGTVGDKIALRWFYNITLDDYNNGAVTQAGYNYGTFNPNGGNPHSDDFWLVPTSGSSLNLNFLTSDALPSPGNPVFAPSTGYASSTVTAIPEPTTLALGALGAGAFFFLRRRRA